MSVPFCSSTLNSLVVLRVGFVQTHFIKAFNEVELELQLTPESIENISKNASHAQYKEYIHEEETSKEESSQ